MIPLVIDYGGNQIRLLLSPQEIAYAVAPLFLVMAGTGRLSILEACATPPEPDPQGVLL